jgi:hypothetical protein
MGECAISVELRTKDGDDGMVEWDEASVPVNLAEFLHLYRL